MLKLVHGSASLIKRYNSLKTMEDLHSLERVLFDARTYGALEDPLGRKAADLVAGGDLERKLHQP